MSSYFKDWYRFEPQTILHLSLLSIFFLLSSFNLITFFISLEFYSFSSIFLVFFSWKNSSYNLRIFGLIYYLINVISSILILFSFLYIYLSYNIFTFNDLFYIINNNYHWRSLFIMGFLIKLGCVPFHFWVLPLYNSAHSFITFFQSIIPKFLYILILYFLLNIYFKELIFIFSILTLILGSCIGLKEEKIKRLMGASSIFNLGLFLMVLNSKDIIFNISIYFFNIIPIFFILFLFYNKRSFFYFDNSWKLSDLKFFPLLYPFFSFLFVLIIFSLIGMPPFGGFFYKLNIFAFSLKDSFWLIFALFSTLVSSIYYLYFIHYIYSFNPFSKYLIFSNNRWDFSFLFTFFSIFSIFFYFYYPYFYFILSLFSF